MTIVSEPPLKSGDVRASPSIREKIHRHEPEGAAETPTIVSKNGGQDPEKPVHTHDNVQGENLRSTTARTVPASTEIAVFPTLPDAFGRENTEYISGYKLFAALFGIVSVFFIVLLDFSIISTAIPYITSDFHRLQDVGWYGGAYQLSSAAFQPLSGKLYTYLNGKQTFLFFAAIFEVGSLLCAVSTSSTFFILGRTVTGLGFSGLENGALVLVTGAVPPQQRPFYISLVFAIGQTGIVIGPLLGGALTQYATWRWCFYINLPIGAVSALFLYFTHVPDETLKPPFSFALLRSIVPNLDLTGCALFVPASVMFLLALQWGSDDYGWSSPTVIGLFAGAGGMAILFSLWEWRVGENALIPFHLIKKRIVWTSTIQNSFLFVTNFVGSNFVPIYFQAVKGVGPTMSGIYMLPSILTQLVALVIAGSLALFITSRPMSGELPSKLTQALLVSRLGYYLPFGILGGAITAVACGLISTWNPDTSTAEWVAYQVLFGFRGLGLQIAVTSVQNAVAPSENSVAIAFLIFAQTILAAIAIIVGNAIFTQTLTRLVPSLAPSVSPREALAAGGSAEAVRALLPPGSPELEGLLLAYSKSVNAVFYLLVAAGVVAFLSAWGMGWVDIRKKAPEETEA